MAFPELQRLIRVLDDREIEFGHDDVAWAFESAKTEDTITSWVNTYLSPATLLTKEEVTFNDANSRTKPDNIVSGYLLSDHDFESAITALEASTAAIETQCKLLEAQKQALREIQARNATNQRSDSTKSQRSSRIIRDRAQVEFDADEVADSLQSRIERSLKQAEGTTNSIQPTIERVLEKDDRLLDGLERALQQICAPALASDDAEEVEKLCQALVKYSSADIHTSIDVAYNSAVLSSANQNTGVNSLELKTQHDSLRAELEELCREIDGLSTMAVDAQHRSSISKALATARSDSDNEKALWTEYLSATLHYLTGRLETMKDESQSIRSNSNALNTVEAALKAVMAAGVEQKQHTQAHARSPTKPSQKGLKPLRLVQANLSESQDPVAQLLRNLHVKTSDSMSLAEEVDKTVREKTSKLSSFASSSERSTCDQIVQSIERPYADVQNLLSAVYAYSPFGSVSLVDEDLTGCVERLEQKTQSVGDEMRQLNVDGIARTIRMKQQELFRQPLA